MVLPSTTKRTVRPGIKTTELSSSEVAPPPDTVKRPSFQATITSLSHVKPLHCKLLHVPPIVSHESGRHLSGETKVGF